LKGITEKGITFYTNFKSRKGQELANNPNCAVVFLWGGLERQVRIEGQVNQLLYEESEEYYNSRPFESRVSAYISPQSEIINDKAELEKQWETLNQKYKETQDIPMPEHWGGYEIICESFEFWQGRPSRFHDRFLYTKANQAWKIERLAP
ncbi:MAG: pyridoxamine 5'-phosphate oxidase, partial [Ignavibacteriae bacterium]|nr:pyridoxamine 5'-phosphate oxidase [Ignavibacteriota bacterium]